MEKYIGHAGLIGGIPTLCLTVYGLMACIYCGKMAMNNPDALIGQDQPLKYCWAFPVNNNPNFVIKDGPGDVEGATNVTQNFLSWFKWGFGLNLAILSLTLVCLTSMTV